MRFCLVVFMIDIWTYMDDELGDLEDSTEIKSYHDLQVGQRKRDQSHIYNFTNSRPGKMAHFKLLPAYCEQNHLQFAD
jgi:hypothetical protein